MKDKEMTIGSVVFDNAPRFPSEINVNVKQSLAPTAEHIRLMQEMRTQVENNILHTFNVQSNTVNLAGYVARNAFPQNDVKVKAIYKLNGKELRIDTAISEADFFVDGLPGVARICFKHIAESLAHQFFEAHGNDFMRAFSKGK